jgi:hypothetical protein
MTRNTILHGPPPSLISDDAVGFILATVAALFLAWRLT